MATGAAATKQQGGLTQRLLNGIKQVGNKVPHPVLMFLYLIAGIIVLSAALALAGVSVTEDIALPAASDTGADYYIAWFMLGLPLGLGYPVAA